MPLRHDAVTRPSHARPQKQLLNILQPTRRFVNEVITTAVAKHPSRQSHFVVVQWDAGRFERLLVYAAHRQRHFRHPQRLALISAVENHIGHLSAPQRLGRLLPQHPTNRIRHIRLPTAVRTDNRRHPASKSIAVRSANDLNPNNVRFFNCIGRQNASIP